MMCSRVVALTAGDVYAADDVCLPVKYNHSSSACDGRQHERFPSFTVVYRRATNFC